MNPNDQRKSSQSENQQARSNFENRYQAELRVLNTRVVLTSPNEKELEKQIETLIGPGTAFDIVSDLPNTMLIRHGNRTVGFFIRYQVPSEWTAQETEQRAA